MTNQTSIKEQIHDFVDGSLADEQVDALWAELIASPDDLDYLQTLATLKKMGSEGKFDRLYNEEPRVLPLVAAESTVTFYERFKPYLVAASVIIIGFVVLFTLMLDVQQMQTTVTDDPISMIEYEIERSAADNQTLLDNYLQEAVSMATRGNLEAAFAKLQEASSLTLSTEQAVDLKMVRGAIQYNSGNYSDALQTFREIKEMEEIDLLTLEKGTWYLANTQLQLGMNHEAISSMREVVELDGAFSRVANQKLERLKTNS